MGDRDLSGRLGCRRHGSQNTGMLTLTIRGDQNDDAKGAGRTAATIKNGMIVRPVVQRMVNLRSVPCIIQTKKFLTACMRSYGNTVNTLLGLRAMVIL
jgi:hypothetical protein